jgi:hypothetical protein
VTRREIVDQIWVATGKSTELTPEATDPNYDTSLNGGPFLSFVANEGQRQVAMWKDPATGRPNRINDLLGVMFYSSHTFTDVISAVNNTTDPYSITLTTIGVGDGRYNGWVVEMTSGDASGEVKFIYDYDAVSGTCYLHDAFSTTPAVGDTIKMYKNFEMLLPPTHFWVGDHISLASATDVAVNDGNLFEVLSIVDLKNGRELEGVTKIDKFPSNILSAGDPTSWYRHGNAIYYDRNVNNKLKFRVEYYRTPMDMTADDSLPDIPEIWHMSIVNWGIHYILKRKMEYSGAYAAKMDFIDGMRRIVGEDYIRKDRLDQGGSVLYREE